MGSGAGEGSVGARRNGPPTKTEGAEEDCEKLKRGRENAAGAIETPGGSGGLRKDPKRGKLDGIANGGRFSQHL